MLSQAHLRLSERSVSGNNHPIDQGWAAPVLGGRCPEGLGCFPVSTHLIHCAKLANKLFELFNLSQVC